MTRRNELIEYEAPGLLSLREIRMAGATANRLTALRGAVASRITGGTLTLKVSSGSQVLSLTDQDTKALVSLLEERDVAFLSALNIETSE